MVAARQAFFRWIGRLRIGEFGLAGFGIYGLVICGSRDFVARLARMNHFPMIQPRFWLGIASLVAFKVVPGVASWFFQPLPKEIEIERSEMSNVNCMKYHL